MLLGLLTAECSGSALAGGAASLVMAIVPAHIMRSVAGGYDNESVAISAMMLTCVFAVVVVARARSNARPPRATIHTV